MATFLTCSFLIEDYTPGETMKFAQIIDRDVDENFLTFLITHI